MTDRNETGWYYWEAGVLVSLVALANTQATSPAQLGYGLLTLLFLFGMAQGLRSESFNQERVSAHSDSRGRRSRP